MNIKGFTLVELLAVIIILSLLALLTSTAVTKLVSDAKDDLSETQIGLIKSATEVWIADNLNKLPDEGECSYLTLKDLKEYGVIDSSVLDPKNSQEISDDLKIKLTTSTTSYGINKTNYEITENISSCKKIYDIICTAVTNETKTLGNIPTGNYLAGDEYICEVKPGVSYTFFILTTEGNKVNLIMNSNINKDGTLSGGNLGYRVDWINREDYILYGGNSELWVGNGSNSKGPITATKAINDITSSWINIDSFNELYDDEGGHYKDFKLEGKARLPKLSEVTATGCSTENNSCPNWMLNFGSNGGGYMLLDTPPDQLKRYLLVGSKNKGIGWDINVPAHYPGGVRPVITVSKYRIQN